MTSSTGAWTRCQPSRSVRESSPREMASFHSFTRFSRVDYSAGATYSYQQVDARTAWVGTPDYYLPLSNAVAGILRMEGRMSGVLF